MICVVVFSGSRVIVFRRGRVCADIFEKIRTIQVCSGVGGGDFFLIYIGLTL